MRGSPILFQNFVGGVNALDAPYNLKNNEARDARNVVSTVRGAIRKRDGAQPFATPGAALTSLYGSNSPLVLIGATGATVYSITSGGTVTSRATGLTAGSLWEWVNAPANGGQGPLYGANGSEARQWDGAAASMSAWTAASGTLPIPKYLLAKANRVWAANMTSYLGVSDASSALAWSDIGNPRAWPAENVNLFDPNDGEGLSGIGTSGAFMLVFKPSKAFIVYDLNTGANRPVGEGVGCVSHRSIVETPYGTYFLSRNQGVMRTNGQTFQSVSDRILPFLRAIPTAMLQRAAGAFFGDHYYLSIAQAGSVNSLLLDYDIKLDSWWIHSLPEADLTVWQANNAVSLYGSKETTAGVRKLFVPGLTQDEGANFTAYWTGPFHTLDRPYQRKRVRAIIFDGKGRIQTSLAKDFQRQPSFALEQNLATDPQVYGADEGSQYGVNDATLYGGPADVAQAKIPTPGVGRAWSVQFGNNTSDSFEVESYALLINGRKG